MLFRSDALSAKEKKQIRRWVGDLASWMEKSEQGRQEAEAANNHSVAYDAQLIAFNAFAGRRDRARKIAQAVPSRRVDPQILPDGSQPEELKRTLAYHYSQYEHLTDILLMSQSLGLPASNALVEKAQAYLTHISTTLAHGHISRFRAWTARAAACAPSSPAGLVRELKTCTGCQTPSCCDSAPASQSLSQALLPSRCL